jgi:hypothetical protein
MCRGVDGCTAAVGGVRDAVSAAVAAAVSAAVDAAGSAADAALGGGGPAAAGGGGVGAGAGAGAGEGEGEGEGEGMPVVSAGRTGSTSSPEIDVTAGRKGCKAPSARAAGAAGRGSAAWAGERAAAVDAAAVAVALLLAMAAKGTAPATASRRSAATSVGGVSTIVGGDALAGVAPGTAAVAAVAAAVAAATGAARRLGALAALASEEEEAGTVDEAESVLTCILPARLSKGSIHPPPLPCHTRKPRAGMTGSQAQGLHRRAGGAGGLPPNPSSIRRARIGSNADPACGSSDGRPPAAGDGEDGCSGTVFSANRAAGAASRWRIMRCYRLKDTSIQSHDRGSPVQRPFIDPGVGGHSRLFSRAC